MEKREDRLLNRWTGSGRLTRDGHTIGTVRYAIREYQTFRLFKRTALDPAQETPGAKNLVFDVTSEELHLWSLIGVTVTLHLEDGRTIDLIHDGDRFVNSSQLRDPK